MSVFSGLVHKIKTFAQAIFFRRVWRVAINDPNIVACGVFPPRFGHLFRAFFGSGIPKAMFVIDRGHVRAVFDLKPLTFVTDLFRRKCHHLSPTRNVVAVTNGFEAHEPSPLMRSQSAA